MNIHMCHSKIMFHPFKYLRYWININIIHIIFDWIYENRISHKFFKNLWNLISLWYYPHNFENVFPIGFSSILNHTNVCINASSFQYFVMNIDVPIEHYSCHPSPNVFNQFVQNYKAKNINPLYHLEMRLEM
jgi:hypothetical protein